MMLNKVFAWLGFGDQRHDSPRGHVDHGHDDHASARGHDHTHGVVDPVITQTTSEHCLLWWGMKPTVLDQRNLVDLHTLTLTH
jgi:hypothetical protein